MMNNISRRAADWPAGAAGRGKGRRHATAATPARERRQHDAFDDAIAARDDFAACHDARDAFLIWSALLPARWRARVSPRRCAPRAARAFLAARRASRLMRALCCTIPRPSIDMHICHRHGF